LRSVTGSSLNTVLTAAPTVTEFEIEWSLIRPTSCIAHDNAHGNAVRDQFKQLRTA